MKNIDQKETIKNELEGHIVSFSSSYRKHKLREVTYEILFPSDNRVVVRLNWGISTCLDYIDLDNEREIKKSKRFIERLFWNLVDMVIERKNKEILLSNLPQS